MKLRTLLGIPLLLTVLCGCGAKLESLRVDNADLSALTVGSERQVTFHALPDAFELSAGDLSLRVDNEDVACAELADVSGHYAMVTVKALAPGEAKIKLVCDGLVSQGYPLTVAAVPEDAPVPLSGETAVVSAENDAPPSDPPSAVTSADAPVQASDGSSAELQPPAGAQTVYLTPSGKRYHVSASCAGKNAYPVSLDQTGEHTPCKKCCK